MANFILKANSNDGFSTPVLSRSSLASLLEPWSGLWGQAENRQSEGLTFPVEIVDFENEVLVKAELPGVGKENIQIDYLEQTLTITSEKKAPEPVEGSRVLRNERGEGKMERRFRLPVPLDFEAAEAHYVDGVLNLRLPKAKPSAQRKIQIQ